VDKDSEQLQALMRDLVPINGLAAQDQTEVINQSEILKIKKRQFAFKQGELDLIADEQLVEQVVGGTDPSRYALARLQPRQMAGKAKTVAIMLKVNRLLLDRLLTLDETGDEGQVEVSDVDAEESTDWMTKLLQSELLARIPPANIQKIFTTMESVDFEAGDVVVEQGTSGDYYYFIQRGHCVVSRKASPESEAVPLAELTDGDSFDEEALVSDVVRNASISMLTDGTLMRLTKEDFIDLIKKLVLNSVSYLKAESVVAGGFKWLDVRFPEEHSDSGVPGSVNVPLNVLRAKDTDLNSETSYVVYCDTGGRSSVAAFLPIQSGFDACHLNGGLMNTPFANLRYRTSLNLRHHAPGLWLQRRPLNRRFRMMRTSKLKFAHQLSTPGSARQICNCRMQ
jgi:CRP-like cAMP-binding protein